MYAQYIANATMYAQNNISSDTTSLLLSLKYVHKGNQANFVTRTLLAHQIL